MLNPEATALVADLLSRFELEIMPSGVFIARGSSGWTKKAVVND